MPASGNFTRCAPRDTKIYAPKIAPFSVYPPRYPEVGDTGTNSSSSSKISPPSMLLAGRGPWEQRASEQKYSEKVTTLP